MLSKQPKIALIHDDFTQLGGAESLFATIANIYKEAPVYTSLVNWEKFPQNIDRERVKTSFMQKVPFAQNIFKALLPLYPLAFESFNLKNYDIVISSTTRFANSVITSPQTIHICYINSTPRFLWNNKQNKNYVPTYLTWLTKPLFLWLKRWDVAASSRVDFYIANSKNIQKNIKKTYNRNSIIVHPFADLSYFKPPKISNWELKSKNYYLVVSRLAKWKRVDIAVKACIRLNKNLIIVGEGSEIANLKKLASKNKNIIFEGKVSRSRLRDLYQNSKGLIVTQQEDFGIAMVEAQACGIPVIAYQKGGQAEIIKDQKTGILFKKQTPKSLEDAISSASKVKWKPHLIRRNTLKFSRGVFTKELKKAVNTYGSKSQ